MELLDLLLDQDPCGLGKLIRFFYPNIVLLIDPGGSQSIGVAAV